MSKKHLPAKDLRSVVRQSRYPLEAFLFVQRGLDHTVRRIHGDPEQAAAHAYEARHVSGRELCLGLRDFALQEYGMLARTVLARWSIHSSEDFGHIVFTMVEAGLMHKTDDDTIDDFIDVLDFSQDFRSELTLSETVG